MNAFPFKSIEQLNDIQNGTLIVIQFFPHLFVCVAVESIYLWNQSDK